MTDKTRSPAPNLLSNLYRQEEEIESLARRHTETAQQLWAELREVRAAIKRACGDAETIIKEK